MKRITILASGSGTNAENLIRYFKERDTAEVVLVAANRPDAYVLERAKKLDVPTWTFTRQQMKVGKLLQKLQEVQADVVVLAGFLWLIPKDVLELFPRRIINIHPALLPKYGGKGMYGMNVHKAVKAAGDSETGITIHVVDEEYDRGLTLFQAKCEVASGETAEVIARKVHRLEMEHFPRVVEEYIQQLPLSQATTGGF